MKSEMPPVFPLFLSAFLALVSRVLCWDWEYVGRLSTIYTYPLKSGSIQEVKRGQCTDLGLMVDGALDRSFIVANPIDGKFVTGRNKPSLILVVAKVTDGVLTLEAPGREPISVRLADVVKENKQQIINMHYTGTVNSEIGGYDCGIEVARWISEYLQEKEIVYHLYYYESDLMNGRQLHKYGAFKTDFEGLNDTTAYADLTGFMLITQASLDDFNAKALNETGEKFDVRRFRANFVVSGTQAYDERNWDKILIGIETTFKNVKDCIRCAMTLIDPDTAEKHPNSEPLNLLNKYNKENGARGPHFGVHLVLEEDGAGRVREGDPVYVIRKEKGTTASSSTSKN